MDFLEPRLLSDDDLLTEIEKQRALMIAVSTGGPRIDDVNREYERRRSEIGRALATRRIADPNPYDSLWAWYGKWSSGDLPSYQSRRSFITELYGPLLDQIRARQIGEARVFPELTGWPRVDTDLSDMRARLERAVAESQFQSVGHASREILITLAQEVFDNGRHADACGDVLPSATDAKRMLEAYIAVELSGSAHEAARKHARAALDLANDLQHRRTATFRDAALCAEATTSVVNLIAIIAGRRDPS
jgi:hypothetical protein